MNYSISPQLEQELQNRITELQNEDRYMKDMLGGLNNSGASSVEDSTQVGTSTPRYFGSSETFITNPSNVGIGILARMIETDATVMSAVQFKSLMMLSKVGEYQHENEEIADFVRSFLKRMEGPTWRESLEGQTSYSAYGFSISEIVWGISKDNKKVPVKVPTYHPSTIAFEVDAFGNITENGVIQFVIQNSQMSNPNQYFPYFQHGYAVKNPFTTPNDRLLPYRIPFINNYGLTRIPKDKCIHHIYNSMLSFGSPYGKTPVRTAHLAWQLKVFFMKQMGIAGKRQASPFVWATAPQNSNNVEIKMPDGSKKLINPIEALTSILANREGDDSVVTGPENQGYKLTAITSQMDLNQYLTVLNWLDTQIFRAFLLPSLVMTDGSAGSRALGDKHFEIVDFIASEEAQKFTETIIKSLIRPAIEMNFGEQDDYGHFAQRPQSIDERERLANMFSTLANSGYMKAYDKKDGDYVRSTLHLPEQEESFYSEPMPDFVNDTGENQEVDSDASNKVKKEDE